jgi:aldose 1-epimerase
MDTYITLTQGNQTLILNPVGGGIVAYYQYVNGERHDIIYGYDAAEKSGSMGDVLFPFPGRVENSTYTFQGTTYQLSGVRIKDGHALHGFAKTAPWSVEEASSSTATLSFSMSEADYAEKGFPFSLRLVLTYILDDTGCRCQATVTNTGSKDAPFGLGFHPYFTVGTETVNDVHLTIQAGNVVEFDANLKPTGFLENPTTTDVDFRTTQVVGDRILDTCFTDLYGDNGVHQTFISDSRGRQVCIWQDSAFPYLQIYSGDTISQEHQRRGLAIEPQTCTGFALNMPEMGLRTLRPDENTTLTWGVRI